MEQISTTSIYLLGQNSAKPKALLCLVDFKEISTPKTASHSSRCDYILAGLCLQRFRMGFSAAILKAVSSNKNDGLYPLSSLPWRKALLLTQHEFCSFPTATHTCGSSPCNIATLRSNFSGK